MERDELVYFKHFWEHILQKQMFEIEQRYFNRIPLATDLYDELRIKFENKNVIPFMDFSVAQRCSLNCRACTQWMPYLRNRKIFSGKEVNDWLEKIFKWIDYVHIISPFGGEAFLNPDFGDILEEMLSYQKKGKIGFIRIVTNGTIYPNKKLQEVLCNPNILILDEATSALDNVTEKMIQKSFDELAKGKTTIMIAHRLTTIQNADEIIVLGKEGIIEKGSHDELMSINGTYSKMYKNGQNLES